VNRPFPAFATLLFILSLAVVAISTQSRPAAVRTWATSNASAVTSKAIGGPNYVLVFPAPAAENRTSNDEWHWVTAGTPAAQLEGLRCPARSKKTPLVSASVSAAEPIDRTVGAMHGMDCRSYHDPAYDAIVHGPLCPALARQGTMGAALTLSDEELLAIFDDLGNSRAAISLRKSTEGVHGSITLWRQARSASAAASQWLLYQFRRLTAEWSLVARGTNGADTPGPRGQPVADYAEFSDFAGDRTE
jgi:hypothetical protein